MPNVSHPAAWSGPYQNSSVFPGCLGLDLMFTGTCFLYGAMLTAEKPHLECGLDVCITLWRLASLLVLCVLVTPQALKRMMFVLHQGTLRVPICTTMTVDVG